MYFDDGLKLDVAQHSRAGVKPVNEDSIGIRVPDDHQLATKGAVVVIADGVSAAEAGKEAAESCVTGFLNDYYSTPDTWSVKRSAQQVLNALNRWLYAQGQSYNAAEKGYVSTLSVAVFKSRTLHIFHVGDTRVYRLRQGIFEQLTRDHARQIGRKQTYLTRAMGLDISLDVDYRAIDIELGDVYLLSSDGVHDSLTASELQAALEGDADLGLIAESLLDSALAADSRDNLSCQLVRVTGLPLEDTQEVYRRLTELPFPPPLTEGAVIDGLVVVEELHASTRSQLYKVYDANADRHYVMKTPSANYEDDPAYIERFILESWIGRRIDHAGVVKIVDGPQAPRSLYYLSEYLEGKTLGRWLETGRPAINDAIDMFESIAKAVLAMHRRDTLHQDIKPDNIMVLPDDSIKVIDFGACYVAGVAEIVTPIERDVVLGTAQYSAPEHVLGRKPGARSDQFSLAVIAFEMLTGKLPYEGRLESCRSSTAFNRLNYISACKYNSLIPVWMDKALQKALSISPELRYNDIAEFVHDLKHPNPAFCQPEYQPLVRRHPLRFWQGLSFVLALALFWSLSR
ncbi:bifunctional protein-serine/threonine kinase/phosphatase [Spongiibacter sp. KMU-158]|uniref:Bifunctional protein-serine/threonine kinase/phosphatase n=1 Tax=Spongiibacter pelagi TaxID=2760804 RepID=A0A927C080_9GAMM|nr:bifunctional protein-serine/threonine kinase/phosphatase [Spongiibacter pelagi]MBD2858854.1 bifunctional protein-serine/threonine kinase/phosphatase [Spongiibacter pelagi]